MNIPAPALPRHFAWTGSRMIDTRFPDPRDILLSEIAVGLSRETRYGGAATAVPWSVAQHLLLCDALAEEDGVSDMETRRVLLMHDAPEYMLRDVLAPVKGHLPDYRRLEDIWWKAVCSRFDLPFEMPRLVKYYDMLACASEKAALISPEAGDWPLMPRARHIPDRLFNLTPRQAEAQFLARAGEMGLNQ